MEQTSIIVIGMLNTDIIASGLDGFPRPNDPVYGGKLKIGPGGKPGNIASMAGYLSEPKSVAMIAKTVEDPYGLWKQPVEGLGKAGVNTDFVKVLTSDETDQLPSVALVAVDKNGDNMCFVLPGVSTEFSEEDIDAANEVFEVVANNKGIFALSMECPLDTAKHALQKAVDLGIKVVFDPGGVVEGMNIKELISKQPYLIKPNEFEARIITGITITDFDTARLAADKLVELGAQNVLITHGPEGAYLFEPNEASHITIPEVREGDSKDATGCGDQSMAMLCVALQQGKSLKEASKLAVLAGTLQFQKLGIQPITKQELEAQL